MISKKKISYFTLETRLDEKVRVHRTGYKLTIKKNGFFIQKDEDFHRINIVDDKAGIKVAMFPEETSMEDIEKEMSKLIDTLGYEIDEFLKNNGITEEYIKGLKEIEETKKPKRRKNE